MARQTKTTDEISEAEFEAANRAGAARRARGIASSVRYFSTGRRLSIRLSTGITLIVPVDQVQDLAGAADEDLRDVLIGPAGLGLHFPRLDADIGVAGLLDGVFGTAAWMAQQLGRAGGSVKSERKAVAARENGKRGGRPPRKPQSARFVTGAVHGDQAVIVHEQESGNAYHLVPATEAVKGLLSGELRSIPPERTDLIEALRGPGGKSVIEHAERAARELGAREASIEEIAQQIDRSGEKESLRGKVGDLAGVPSGAQGREVSPSDGKPPRRRGLRI
ncbi:DUF2442 domain-containing protein [Methylobacterium sp. J-048]|uniref:DUF2442 domain-containing protein n=1 Tax=Methylobacterium sp. J-048 TaxID=2836635 RepID=UPI001FB897FF|nr:DUF2442 domain-containing protein [Methylobacterium sp. J-048]MCJ2059836.1 DUF2442 domain-containing protein [Methylobacterium sp. J-048]